MEVVLLLLVSFMFLMSLIGIIAPVIPSLPLAWVGIFLYGVFTDFAVVDAHLIVISFLIMLCGIVVDFVAGTLGAKILGASWTGLLGAVIGSIVGLFFWYDSRGSHWRICRRVSW